MSRIIQFFRDETHFHVNIMACVTGGLTIGKNVIKKVQMFFVQILMLDNVKLKQ